MEADSPPRPRFRRLALELPLVLVAASLIIYCALRMRANDGGLITVADHQAAVLVDFRTGRLTPDVSPGTKTFVPWLQRWYRLDRRPIEYVMEGNEHLHENRVPRLLVRGSDGTSFLFERVELQYTGSRSRQSRFGVSPHGGPTPEFRPDECGARARRSVFESVRDRPTEAGAGELRLRRRRGRWTTP